MTEYEKKLIDHGFSVKDIGKLKSIIEKDESQQDTMQSLILDLSKRFFGGVFGIFILMIIGLYGIFNADESDAISYIIVLGFAFLVIYFVTPLKLSWKAYKFIRQSKV